MDHHGTGWHNIGIIRAHGMGNIHLISIIGEIEGHENLSNNSKTTKYEHILPQLAAIEDSREIDGVLILLNTMGGDVEAGLASYRGVWKPHPLFLLLYIKSLRPPLPALQVWSPHPWSAHLWCRLRSAQIIPI